MTTTKTAPTERPIIFNGPMVRSLRAGRKTQTRRPVGFTPLTPGLNFGWSDLRAEQRGDAFLLTGPGGSGWEDKTRPTPCPFGKPGDRLWVRETHAFVTCDEGVPGAFLGADRRISSDFGSGWFRTEFVADHDTIDWDPPKLRPSIHMPRWASRLLLEVVAVRVERLQAIQHNEADAIAEGLTVVLDRAGEDFPCTYGVDGNQTNRTAWAAFARLWKSIYRECDHVLQTPAHACAWSHNPWVWVVTFKVVEGRQ